MDDDESSTIFENFNSRFDIKIDTTFINKNDYTKNLAGYFTFKNNKLDKLNLASTFPNKKKMNLSIETNNQNETITKFFSNYPKPLIKRYDFFGWNKKISSIAIFYFDYVADFTKTCYI